MSTRVTELPDPTAVTDDLDIVDFVAGRMSEQARDAFALRLQNDAQLAERVEQEIALRDRLLSGSPADETPRAEAFDRLRRRIESEQQPLLRFRKPLAIAAGLAVALFIGGQLDAPQPLFETLSSDPSRPVAGELRYRIVFSADDDRAQRQNVADTYGFSIVSGPGAGGTYIVETEQPVSSAELDRWRDDTRIVFAEPVTYE
ncbi:MAG: hypothetical protein AAGA61_08815 [Pseudomonadota bacterium]